MLDDTIYDWLELSKATQLCHGLDNDEAIGNLDAPIVVPGTGLDARYSFSAGVNPQRLTHSVIPSGFPITVNPSELSLHSASIASAEGFLTDAELNELTNVICTLNTGLESNGTPTLAHSSLHETHYAVQPRSHQHGQSYISNQRAHPTGATVLDSVTSGHLSAQSESFDNVLYHPAPSDFSESSALQISQGAMLPTHSIPEISQGPPSAQLPEAPTSQNDSFETGASIHVHHPKEKGKKHSSKLSPCPKCGKLLDPKRSNWERHMDIHYGLKRFKCNYQHCGEHKRTKGQVVIHIVMHHLGVKLGKGVRPSLEQRKHAELFVVQL